MHGTFVILEADSQVNCVREYLYVLNVYYNRNKKRKNIYIIYHVLFVA